MSEIAGFGGRNRAKPPYGMLMLPATVQSGNEARGIAAENGPDVAGPRAGETSMAGDESNDDSSDVECPTCGRDDFKRRQDMTTHHKKKHGESIAGVELVCEQCGETYRKEHHAADESRFCSDGCKNEWQSENLVGENSHTWKGGGVKLSCEQCGETYRKKPSEAAESRFCSYECLGAFNAESNTGANNAEWKGGKVELVCEQCDGTYERHPAYVEKSRFCSQSCCGEWQSENRAGENTSNWKGGDIELVCDQCGDVYWERRDKTDRSRFCSRECYGEWRSETLIGENHNWWQGGKVEVVCEQCEKPFKVKQSHAERKFCSQKCMGRWYSENLAGESSPHWEGGTLPYGEGWNEAKKELVRERDGRECRVCGKSESDHLAERAEKHTIHHIVEARTLEDAPADLRNGAFNLVSMCRSHHGYWERIPSLLQFMAFLPHPPLPTEQATLSAWRSEQ